MAKLIETVFMDKAPVVDREAGTIKHVKLLGRESKNGRRYSDKALESASKRYPNSKNYIDHDRSEGFVERGMAEWASVIDRAYVESDGVYGDLTLRQKSPHYEALIEAAEKFPKHFGMSHVADGVSRMEGSVELIEDVTDVFSVDFVTTPATTKGLFESASPKKSIRRAVESLPDSPSRKRLLEMFDGYDTASGAEPKEQATPDDPSTSIIKELIRQLGDALKALASKPAAPSPAPVPAADPANPANPDAKASPEDDMSKEEKDEAVKTKAAFESLQRESVADKAKLAETQAKCLLLESGREASEVQVKALVATPEADRKALLESWPLIESTVERPRYSPALIESEGGEDFPRDPEKFAASLR